MGYKAILVEKKGGIAKITLNRPDAMNGLDDQMLLDMEAALIDFESDGAVRVVVVTGAGRAFCAGADLKYQKTIIGHVDRVWAFTRKAQQVMNMFEQLSKPVIAAVNGYAVAGGLEIMMCCDLAIAADSAKLGDGHANYGVVPGGGSSQRLPRTIGVKKAKELLYTGGFVQGQEAVDIGLVNKVVPADKLDEAVIEMASKISDKAPLALKAVKNLVNQGLQTDLYTGLELECQANVLNTTTEDYNEGLAAFKEKRKPEFKGR